jgi:hypothetical protein
MILPCPEITDVALVAKLACPWLRGGNYGVINADRKQHKLLPVAFFRERLGHLILDPIAGDRIFGKNEQKLVPEFNRFINRIPCLGPDRQIMWRKPASDSLVLEIGMQTLRKILVFAGMADEATVHLDGLVQQGWQIVDEGIWKTHTTQKHQWQTARSLQRTIINDAGTPVVTSLKSRDGRKINIGKNGFKQPYSTQICPAEIRLSEVCPVEHCLTEVRPGEIRQPEVRLSEVRSAEVCSDEACPAEVSLPEVRPEEARPIKLGIAEVRTAEIRLSEIRLSTSLQLLAGMVPQSGALPK